MLLFTIFHTFGHTIQSIIIGPHWFSKVHPVELRPPSDMQDYRTVVDPSYGGGFIKSKSGFQVKIIDRISPVLTFLKGLLSSYQSLVP